MARTRRRDTGNTPPSGSTLTGMRMLRDNLPRPVPTPGSASGGGGGPITPVAPRRRFGFFRRFEPRFLADIIAELRKVTWPTFAETRYLTVVVAIVAIAVGILLGGVDLVFGWVIERLFF